MTAAETTEPIFKTVGQTLYIVYAMEVTYFSAKGATEVALRTMMEERYGETRDERDRQINMGTMTTQDLRAQCSIVRKWVEDLLTRSERSIVWARYGQRKFSMSGHEVVMDRRKEGVEGLVSDFANLCGTNDDRVVFALLMGLFASGAGRRRSENSLRTIEREMGISKSQLHRDQVILRQACVGLEIRAISRLEDHFARKGLILDPALSA